MSARFARVPELTACPPVPLASRSALHLAAIYDQPEVCRHLIAAGAPLEMADAQGWRPLHMAAGAGRDAIARLLLASGADAAAMRWRHTSGWS